MTPEEQMARVRAYWEHHAPRPDRRMVLLPLLVMLAGIALAFAVGLVAGWLLGGLR